MLFKRNETWYYKFTISGKQYTDLLAPQTKLRHKK